MDEQAATFELFGLTFDWSIILSTLLASAIVIALAVWMTRKLGVRPSKRQNAIEWLLDFTQGVVKGQLPESQARQYGLYIFSLFFFILIANEMGLLLQLKFGDTTLIKSPTADPLVTMTLAMMSLIVAHSAGIHKLGPSGYLKNMLLHPYSWLLPLNIIEQLANFLTLSLRLFGNIFAGEMLLNLLANSLALPEGKYHGIVQLVLAFPLEMLWQGFSLFIGAVQAYVFVVLTSVFIAQLSGEE